MMTLNSTLTIFFVVQAHVLLKDTSRSLMMLDSASRLICNGTFDEKRMAEEITFEMDFWSGFFSLFSRVGRCGNAMKMGFCKRVFC